jgi:murein DD-endopeptidase MepM/ murein hydrolase activator NlpD
MGRVARRRAFLAAAGLALLAALPACRSLPAPGEGDGSWYVVHPGDNLWQISQRSGISVDRIRRVNRVADVRALRVGERLWVPGGSVGAAPAPAPVAADASSLQHWGGDCSDAERDDHLAFEWPLLGTMTSSFGASRGGHVHEGIDLAAPKGTPIHAAEAGKVVYAGDGLGDYGRVIVIKHQGSWATVYAHNSRNLVREGAFVEKGDVIARVGQTGNATAPHLHFEIRRSSHPRDPLACLP